MTNDRYTCCPTYSKDRSVRGLHSKGIDRGKLSENEGGRTRKGIVKDRLRVDGGRRDLEPGKHWIGARRRSSNPWK